MKSQLPFVAGLLLLVLTGCAAREEGTPTTPPAPTGKSVVASQKAVVSASDASDDDDWGDTAEVKVHDPIEPVNRGVFWFNHQLYTYVAKPFSTAYKFAFPELVRKGIRNAYDNVRFPVRFVNHILQGRLDRTAQETGRFVVNSTVGVGGLMKPADKVPALADIPKADTGQTFAKWGIPHGPYLVFPVLGPTSCRDLVGTAGDTVLNPVSWLGFIFPGAGWTVGVSAPSGAHSVPDRMDTYDMATKDALDPYISARTGYVQYRNAQTAK
jgi:phospholipid-binding lipoprotein MlaA